MELSDFKLETSSFEYRYGQSFLLWDKAGSIWTEAVQRWPKLKLVRGEPGVTTFTLDNLYELAVSIDKVHVISHFPSIENFVELCEAFTTMTHRQLELRQFTRLGFRLIYFRQFPTKETASDAVFATHRL